MQVQTIFPFSRERWELLVADAWADPKLKERLLTNTAEVLKERGVESLSGKTIRVVEETADTSYFVLPAKPAEEPMAEERKNW